MIHAKRFNHKAMGLAVIGIILLPLTLLFLLIYSTYNLALQFMDEED